MAVPNDDSGGRRDLNVILLANAVFVLNEPKLKLFDEFIHITYGYTYVTYSSTVRKR